MYKCNNCSCIFEEPITIKTTFEAYYGVDGEFAWYTPLDLDVCPNCNDEDFYELKQCDECENWFERVVNIDEKVICESCFDDLSAS